MEATRGFCFFVFLEASPGLWGSPPGRVGAGLGLEVIPESPLARRPCWEPATSLRDSERILNRAVAFCGFPPQGFVLDCSSSSGLSAVARSNPSGLLVWRGRPGYLVPGNQCRVQTQPRSTHKGREERPPSTTGTPHFACFFWGGGGWGHSFILSVPRVLSFIPLCSYLLPGSRVDTVRGLPLSSEPAATRGEEAAGLLHHKKAFVRKKEAPESSWKERVRLQGLSLRLPSPRAAGWPAPEPDSCKILLNLRC